jgi:glucose-1-phosphate thymidylyltransferase
VELGASSRCLRVEIAKAVILAGRTIDDQPWPSVKFEPKQLFPVANRPILFHNLEALRRGNLLEATIATEPGYERAIQAAVGDGSPWGLTVHYASWQPPTGVAGALAATREFISDEPLLVAPADALLREQIHPHIARFAQRRLDAMALQLPAPARSDRRTPTIGGYMLSPLAVSILLARAGATGDVLAEVRRRGGDVRVQEIDGCLPCHGGQDQLLVGNRRVLETLPGNVDPERFPTCDFEGPVSVDPTARLEHTLIRGPVVIGPRCRLSHAYVGPYTSIGADVTIEGVQIEHSIVLAEAELRHVGTRLETSVIGRGARVSRSFRLPSAMRLALGDGAEVMLT